MKQSILDHIIQEELALYEEEQDSLVLQEDMPSVLDMAKYGLFGIAAVGMARGGWRAWSRFIGRTSKASKIVSKGVAEAEAKILSGALSNTTKTALQAETSALSRSSQKLFDKVDDFIEGAGGLVQRGKLDKTAIESVKRKIISSVDDVSVKSDALSAKIENVLRTPGITAAEKQALKTSLKQIKTQKQALATISKNIGKAEKMDDVAVQVLAISQKHGNKFFTKWAEKMALKQKYGESIGKQVIKGAAKKVIGVGGGLIGFLFTSAIRVVLGGYFLKFTWEYILKDAFDAEEIIEFFGDMFGSVEKAAYLVHVVGRFFGIDDWKGAVISEIDGRSFIRTMISEGEEEERVKLMKNLLASLAMTRMTNYKKVPYPKALQAVQDYMDNINSTYSATEQTATKALVKKNALAALKQAQTEILAGKIPMKDFVNYVIKNSPKQIPAGVDAAEFLYENYFFKAVKQAYPGFPINESALFGPDQDTRTMALQDMVKYLKSVGAKKSIIGVIERKISNPAENVVLNSSLRGFIERKYFSGSEAAYVNNVKDKATNIAYNDVKNIITKH